MTLESSFGKQGGIKSRDLRVCGFYAYWLKEYRNIDTGNIPRQDAESFRQALNKLINQHCPDKEQQSILMSKMEMSREVNILSLEEFDWLTNDERAVFWLWGYLFQIDDYSLGISPPTGHEFDVIKSDKSAATNWYKRLQLNSSPSGHQDRIKLIILFFDKTFVPVQAGVHHKKKVMEKLKDKWKVIYNKPTPLKWLPDREDAVSWAWSHLQKVQQEKIDAPVGLYDNLYSPGLTTWFKPINYTESNLALRAALDLWEDEPDSKKLFLLNLNKAWNQQKLRQSRTDKKALNTYLKNETKMRLDLMAEKSGLRISDMLEKLINEHYRNTLGSK